MKSYRRPRQLPLLLLISALLLISCQQTPDAKPPENTTETTLPAAPAENVTLQSGYEIPQGLMAVREPTYDDVLAAPGIFGASYRGNIHQAGKPPTFQEVESTLVKLDDGLQVIYRNQMQTNAGQVRVNMITIYRVPTLSMAMANDKVNVKLLSPQHDIQVKRIEEGLTGNDSNYVIILAVEIPPKTEPGDYDVAFLLFINDKYQATLPCTLHITK